MSGSGKDLGQGYVNFARNNMDQIRGKINDELWILTFFEQWYTSQINMLCNWLSERLGHSLHFYQCTCLAHIVKVCFDEQKANRQMGPFLSKSSTNDKITN